MSERRARRGEQVTRETIARIVAEMVMIDIEAEGNLIFEPLVGQSRQTKQGITRDQAMRYYARKSAVDTAERTRYQDGSGTNS